MVVDLGGKTLLPGFIDAHGHVFNVGVQAVAANLLAAPDGQVTDIASLQATLRTWAETSPAVVARTGWIIGMGYDDSQLREQRHPTRDDLDAVSKVTPVLVVHQSGHLAVLNSKGLEAVGYSAETVEPPGGTIRRRAGSREPDGLIGGMAWFPHLFSKLGTLGSEDNKALLLAGIDRYAEFGFTTAQEGRATAEAVATEAALAELGKLKMDVGRVSRHPGGRVRDWRAVPVEDLHRAFPHRRGQADARRLSSGQDRVAHRAVSGRARGPGRGLLGLPGDDGRAGERASSTRRSRTAGRSLFTATAMRRRTSSSAPCAWRPPSTAPAIAGR